MLTFDFFRHDFFLPSNVTVNQNHFTPEKPSTTPVPRVVHRWSSSWSSWSSWGPDGKVHTGSTKTFTSFDGPETTTPRAETTTTRARVTTTSRPTTTTTRATTTTRPTTTTRRFTTTTRPTTTPRVQTTTSRVQTDPRIIITDRRPFSTVHVSSQQLVFRNPQPQRPSNQRTPPRQTVSSQTIPPRQTSFSRQRIVTSAQEVPANRNQQPRTNQNSNHFVDRMVSRPRVFRPPVIHSPTEQRYRGPTYNCRILTPEKDGRPSPKNDFSCLLKYPGFPADDSCKCTYEVEARDEHGCATGFLYTCFKQV